MPLLTKAQVYHLRSALTTPTLDDFQRMHGGQMIEHPHDPTKKCLYLRTHPDSKVLAVAHTDTVEWTDTPKMNMECTRLFAGQLDDRLGVWLITSALHEVLPKGMPFDVLLTDFEEKGQSTAVLFTPPEGKEYNWIFEWDRHGDDVVMYDYETDELKKLLESYDFKVGKGSFTDICVMTRLGISAFNFGTAYYREHTKDCNANLVELITQVKKFIPFYSKNYNVKLPSKSSEKTWKTSWIHDIKPAGGTQEGNEVAPFRMNQHRMLT